MTVYSSTSSARHDCEKLHNEFVMNKRIGDVSAAGNVYSVMRRMNKEHPYALKVTECNNHEFDECYKSWDREVQLHRKLYECQKQHSTRSGRPQQWVVQIVDAWFCRKNKVNGKACFYILMEKWTGSVSQLLDKCFKRLYRHRQRLDRGEDGSVTEERAIRAQHQIDILMRFVVMKRKDIHTIHDQCGIALGDVHFGNLLFRRTGPGQYTVVFADFGRSREIESKSDKDDDLDQFDNEVEDTQKTINLLRIEDTYYRTASSTSDDELDHPVYHDPSIDVSYI